jgi:hypothetical protein
MRILSVRTVLASPSCAVASAALLIGSVFGVETANARTADLGDGYFYSWVQNPSYDPSAGIQPQNLAGHCAVFYNGRELGSSDAFLDANACEEYANDIKTAGIGERRIGPQAAGPRPQPQPSYGPGGTPQQWVDTRARHVCASTAGNPDSYRTCLVDMNRALAQCAATTVGHESCVQNAFRFAQQARINGINGVKCGAIVNGQSLCPNVRPQVVHREEHTHAKAANKNDHSVKHTNGEPIVHPVHKVQPPAKASQHQHRVEPKKRSG